MISASKHYRDEYYPHFGDELILGPVSRLARKWEHKLMRPLWSGLRRAPAPGRGAQGRKGVGVTGP